MSGFALVRRMLGVDFGRARIGVAISDELGMLAHPLETIPAARIDVAAKRVAELAKERNVERVVLGMPRHMRSDSLCQQITAASCLRASSLGRTPDDVGSESRTS
jgi:putative transcription antitermination factor YqgF